MHKYLIRYVKAADYAQIESIFRQVHQMHVEWRPDVYQMAETIFSYELFQSCLEQKTLVVAEQEGSVIGVLQYTDKQMISNGKVSKKTLFIDRMGVKEEYRGRGIGTQLFDFVREIAQEHDCDSIELQVNAKNMQANRMYKGYGFSEKSINMEFAVPKK